MSGACCPDCSETWFQGPPEKSHGTVCGWEGDLSQLPRAWPAEEADGPSLHDLRQAGRLCFVRVTFDPVRMDDALSAVMRRLGVQGASLTGPRARMQLDARPSDETLAALAGIPGVLGVTAF